MHYSADLIYTMGDVVDKLYKGNLPTPAICAPPDVIMPFACIRNKRLSVITVRKFR